MTVTYIRDVSESRIKVFLRLLLRWRGSVYKYIYFDVIVYSIFYIVLQLIYRIVLPENSKIKRGFEDMVKYCQTSAQTIPVTFVLGFFVMMVVKRRWDQFVTIPWVDQVALMLTSHLLGRQTRQRLFRRTIVRYLNLSSALCFQSISSVTFKLFPTMEHFVKAGLMTVEEQQAYETIEMPYNKFYVPLCWAVTLIRQARKENLIECDWPTDLLVNEVCNYRDQLQKLFFYDWVNPPLVYTQVTTICVYSYLMVTVIGYQVIDSMKTDKSESEPQKVVTMIAAAIRFIVFLGWLEVGQRMINPFTEDDEAFEMNIILERNVQVGYFYVDKMHHYHPQLLKDVYWNQPEFYLPNMKRESRSPDSSTE